MHGTGDRLSLTGQANAMRLVAAPTSDGRRVAPANARYSTSGTVMRWVLTVGMLAAASPMLAGSYAHRYGACDAGQTATPVYASTQSTKPLANGCYPAQRLQPVGRMPVEVAQDPGHPEGSLIYRNLRPDPQAPWADRGFQGVTLYMGPGDQGPDRRYQHIDSGDINQSDNIGDCVLLAGLQGARPALIRNAIRDNRNGSFTVTFNPPLLDFGLTRTKASRATPVTVSQEDFNPNTRYGGIQMVRLDSGEVAYVQEIWPLVMEAGYAKLVGDGDVRKGFAMMRDGIAPEEGLRALMGKRPVVERGWGGTGVRPAWKAIQEAVADERIFIMGTKPGVSNLGPIFAGFIGNEERSVALVDKHAYAIVDHEEDEAGTRYVHFAHPWGAGNDRTWGKPNVVVVPYDGLKLYFNMSAYEPG